MDTSTQEKENRARKPGVGALYWVSAGMVAFAAAIHLLYVPAGAVADAPFQIPWWSLAAAFAVFEFGVVIVKVQKDPHTVSLSDVPFVLGLLLAAPGALVLGRLVGTTIGLLARRHAVSKVAFNLGMHYLQTVVTLALLRALMGGASGGSLVTWVLVLATHAGATILSGALVLLAIRLTDRRRRPREIARSLAAGLAISVGTGLISVLFLIAVWAKPWAMLVVAVATGMLYLAIRVFGTLSDQHAELKSVHAFSTSMGVLESDATLNEATMRSLAMNLGVDVVEAAAHHMLADGPHWFFSRLDGDGFTTEMDDEAGTTRLIDSVADLRVVSIADLAPNAAAQLAARGISEGLIFGFRPNGLSGYFAFGNRIPTRRSFESTKPLLVTLTGPMIANLERAALIDRLRGEIETKEHQRLHDGLTGLPNRSGFMEALADAMAGDAERFAVAVIDLDRFQEVNDVFGPERGDAVLVEIAKRLRAEIRSGDVLARLGGDEFAVLFNGVSDTDATLSLARRIGDAFLTPFSLDEASLALSASTGISLYPEHGEDGDTLVRRADMARSIAKAARGTIEVFDLEQDLAAERRLLLANDLRPAIESDQLQVAYQPKIELETGTTVGFEALARWTHRQLGRISPAEFINLAQHSGLIGPLTFSVLETALGDVAAWRKISPALSVSVNVAAEILAEEEFADRIRGALDRHGLAPDALILEITESQNLAVDRRTRDSVLRLAAAGIVLSIDDFGTGYSALSYLQNLPVGEVKIDRTFVTRMAEHPGDRAIVEGTIQLLHSVGLRVVAEGIETRDVWDLLSALGCYAAQGYFMSRPLDPEEASAWAASPGWTLESATVD